MLGVVRLPRRPSGWRAPGPAPASPQDQLDLWPRPGEDLCYLSGDWRILQRVDGHRWSLDDLVTAWVAADELVAGRPYPDTALRIADLGCGIGAVLMMMAWRFPETRLVGVEAQEISVDLARRSLAWNGADDRCAVRLGDLRDPAVLPESGAFDLVTGTPPYLPPGTATESRRIQWAPCHFEHRGGIEAYCQTAARLMAPGGCFVVCAAATQAARVAASTAAAGLGMVRYLEVIPRQGKGALFRVYVMRHQIDGASAPNPRVDPPLVVRDAAGRRTEQFRIVRCAMGMPP